VKSCRRYGWVVVTSAMLAPATPASADDGGVVGWVESTRGVPLAGAVISVFGKTIHGNRVTLSDAEGQFILPSLPPGAYTLRAVSTGHQPSAARHITVLPDRDALFTLSLAPLGEKAIAEGAREREQEGERQAALREWLWLMRHKHRSVLETASHEDEIWKGDRMVRASRPAAASLDDAPLNGRVEFAAASGVTVLSPDSLGALRLSGRLADGVRWSLGGLVAENEGRAWRMAAQFVIDPGGGHTIDAGAGYGAGDTRMLFANGDLQPDRTTGAVFAKDRWQISNRLAATAGGRYTYVGFLSDAHHADAVLQIELLGSPGTVLRGSVLARSMVPGGDLLTLSTVAASPAITWARLGSHLRTARTYRCEVGMDHHSGPVQVGAYVFEERTDDILLTTFDGSIPTVRNNGEVDARGFGVTLGRRFGSVVNGSVTYSFGRTRRLGPFLEETPATAFESAAFHDVVARLETVIDWSDTRLAASYRFNTTADEGWGSTDSPKTTASRFDVQLTQGLPFLQPLTRADWELLVAVRNMFYEATQAAFLDELAVQDPPTRLVGGISVRF
jgi:hypothetical protein